MSVHNMHLLAPGESFQPWPKPPAPPNPPDLEHKDAAATCAGCGAGLQAGRWSCAWCTLPYPHALQGDLGALIEVTSLADPWPRYWPGWEPPRPSLRPMVELLDDAEADHERAMRSHRRRLQRPLPPPSRVMAEGDVASARRVWEERYSAKPARRLWLYVLAFPLAWFALALGVWVAKL